MKAEFMNAPKIPEVVYENLPALLGTSCRFISVPSERDLFLTASLPVIASHLKHVLAEHADGMLSADLYMFLLDESGVGAKQVNKAHHFGKQLHQNLFESAVSKTDRLYIEYSSDFQSFCRRFHENGERGVWYETELEKLYKGQLTRIDREELLRLAKKSFHHQQFGIECNNKRYFFRDAHLSICFAGNYKEFNKLRHSFGDDLLSLFSIYACDEAETWKSHRPDPELRLLNKEIHQSSRRLTALFQTLETRSSPLHVEMTPEQWDILDDTFAEKNQLIQEMELPEVLKTYNNTAAITALKLTTIFSVLRQFENEPDALAHIPVLTPANQDLTSALWLADTYIKHSVRLIQGKSIPDSDYDHSDIKGERFIRYFRKLPDSFKTAEAVEVAGKMEIPERTAKRYLGNMLESQKLKRVKRGYYQKIYYE